MTSPFKNHESVGFRQSSKANLRKGDTMPESIEKFRPSNHVGYIILKRKRQEDFTFLLKFAKPMEEGIFKAIESSGDHVHQFWLYSSRYIIIIYKILSNHFIFRATELSISLFLWQKGPSQLPRAISHSQLTSTSIYFNKYNPDEQMFLVSQ